GGTLFIERRPLSLTPQKGFLVRRVWQDFHHHIHQHEKPESERCQYDGDALRAHHEPSPPGKDRGSRRALRSSVPLRSRTWGAGCCVCTGVLRPCNTSYG